MLLIQLALAQHFTVHFQEQEYTALLSQDGRAHPAQDMQGQNKHDDDKQDPDKICQICIYSKYFGHALLAATPFIPYSLIATTYIATYFHVTLKQYAKVAYFSRGPPPALS